VLIHEATFAEEELVRAAETCHSTAVQAASLARDAEVGTLALTHISSRYPAGLLRDEARSIFPGAIIPRDFDTIEIPFPERGAPALIHWDDRVAALDGERPGAVPAAGRPDQEQ
jgi:ribonuclease Z